MANEAYRAVFLRVHPTGKMVLSLTTEPDGNEGRYAQIVADELGVPALDVNRIVFGAQVVAIVLILAVRSVSRARVVAFPRA